MVILPGEKGLFSPRRKGWHSCNKERHPYLAKVVLWDENPPDLSRFLSTVYDTTTEGHTG